jgi:hypothetical protein
MEVEMFLVGVIPARRDHALDPIRKALRLSLQTGADDCHDEQRRMSAIAKITISRNIIPCRQKCSCRCN